MVKLGQRLQKIRTQRKQSLAEVAHTLKIKESFLVAIEKGEYDKLPSPAYAQGFVLNYASYLGLSKTEVKAFFKREFDEKKAYQVLPRTMVKKKEFPIRRVRIQQSIIGLGVLLLIFVAYLLFQYRGAVLSPGLEIKTPEEASLVNEEVKVTGKADANATVTVNGEIVSLNADGTFQKDIRLFSGEETIVVTATNRFGKETVLKRNVFVE